MYQPFGTDWWPILVGISCAHRDWTLRPPGGSMTVFSCFIVICFHIVPLKPHGTIPHWSPNVHIMGQISHYLWSVWFIPLVPLRGQPGEWVVYQMFHVHGLMDCQYNTLLWGESLRGLHNAAGPLDVPLKHCDIHSSQTSLGAEFYAFHFKIFSKLYFCDINPSI